MCTLNITLSDAIMNRVQSSFPSQKAIVEYAQKRLEEIFVDYADNIKEEQEVEAMKSAMSFIDTLVVPGGKNIPLQVDSIEY